MTPVWVNGKFLTSDTKKAEKWSPAPPKEKKGWGYCPCGADIYEGDSVGMHGDHVKVVCYDCWITGKFPDMHLDCVGLTFPDATLSQ